MKRQKRILTFCYSIIFAACFVVPLPCFSDEWIIPKWYLSAIAIAIVIPIRIFVIRRVCHPIRLLALSQAATYIITLECSYVLFFDYLFNSNRTWLCGTFDNPAILALHLTILFPLVLGRFRIRTLSSTSLFKTIVVITAISIVVLTSSRTGIITIVILFSIYLINSKKLSKTLSIFIIVITFIGVAVMSMNIKKDSTSGRYFIALTTMNIIKDNPLFGYGPDGFQKEYMKRQGLYFKNNPDSKYAILASDVNHPLNEFLLLWVKYGITGPIVLILLLVTPIIKQVYSVIPIAIFALFSYPLNYPLTWLILLGSNLFLFYNIWLKDLLFIRKTISIILIRSTVISLSCIALVVIIREWRYDYKWCQAMHGAERGHSKDVVPVYDKLNLHYQNDIYFLYNYMAVLFHAGYFRQSIKIYTDLARRYSGYNIELLAGDCFRQVNNNDSALVHYQMASYMCPCRFAPLEGMYLSYHSQRDIIRRDSIAKLIENKQVKIKSYDVMRIKHLSESIQ